MPTHLIGSKSTRNNESIESACLNGVNLRIDYNGVPVLPFVRLVAQARDGRYSAFLFESDLGEPELQVLIERAGEE